MTRRDSGKDVLRLGLSSSVLNLNHEVSNRRWGKRCLIGGKPLVHVFDARSQGIGDINGEIRNSIDPLHELKHRYSLDDYRQGRSDTALDDAVDLVVEMNKVVPRGNEEQIGFDQRHIEVPRKIAPERGFADPEAAVDGHDDTRQAAQDGRQRVDDLQIGGKDLGHDDAWRTGSGDA